MKTILFIATTFLLFGCANTKTIYKKISHEPKIKIPSNNLVLLQIKELNGGGSLFSNESNFAALSFKDILAQELQNNTSINLVHGLSRNEVIIDRLANRKSRELKPDFIIYLNYEEIQGIVPYSSDSYGSKSKVFFAKGRVSYKIVNIRSSKIIDSGSLFQRFQENITDYIFINGEQIIGPNTEKLAMRVRRFISNQFVNLFKNTHKEIKLKLKNGSSDIFAKVADLAEQNKLEEAIVYQSKILKNLKKKNDISDSNYNLAILNLLLGKKEKAEMHASHVSNGFFSKDFTSLRYLIDEF